MLWCVADIRTYKLKVLWNYTSTAVLQDKVV